MSFMRGSKRPILRSFHLRTLFILTFIVWLFGAQITQAYRTDRAVYQLPPLPVLPQAGGKFTDPVFNTQVMRVTDEGDGVSNGTFYSFWPTFNCNNTRLLVRRNNGDAIYSVDPANCTVGSSYHLPGLPGGGSMITEGAVWSASDPNTLYGAAWNGPRLWAFNASTRTYTLARDFSGQFNAGDHLAQM